MENSETLELISRGFVIAFIFLVGFIWTKLRDRRVKARIDETWSKLAANTGLDYTRHSIHGYFRGFELKMTVHNPGFSGAATGHSGNCTRIQIYTKNVTGATLTLQRIAGPRSLHLKAIRIGDESFDRKAVVRASSREFATTVLAPPTREQFLRLLARHRSILVTLTCQGELTYLQEGIDKDEAYLLLAFDFLANLAAAIERFV